MDRNKEISVVPGAGGTAAARAKETDIVAIALAAVEGSPEREARIASLRERYRTGTYHVNSSFLAARILEHHTGKK